LLPRYDFFQQCVQVFETENIPFLTSTTSNWSFSLSSPDHGGDRRTPKISADGRIVDASNVALARRGYTPRCTSPEAVMVGIGGFDNTDFDALEAMQCMLERRKGGETGVKAVQLLEGDEVWAAGKAGRWSRIC